MLCFGEERIFLFWALKEVHAWAIITACQIAPAQEIILIFFLSVCRALRNKSTPLRHPPQSNFPWQGTSEWGVCMDREGPVFLLFFFVCACPCVFVRAYTCAHVRFRGVVPPSILPKMLQLSLRLNSTSGYIRLPFYLLCLLYLLIFVSKDKYIICVEK